MSRSVSTTTRVPPERRPWLAVMAGLLVAAGLGAMGSRAQELVSFPTADGGTVFAHLRGSGDHAIVLVHGGQFTKESWTVQATALSERGFRTLAVDLRGRGQSRGGSGAELDDDAAYLDVIAAVEFLRAQGATGVSLIGASYGGWAAARAATELEVGTIDRVVLLAHSPIARPELLQGRKLFITTRDDFMGGGALRLPSIRDQFDRAPEPKELIILDGSAHAQHVFATEQAEVLLDAIIRFMTAD